MEIVFVQRGGAKKTQQCTAVISGLPGESLNE
jgi:hypothetical protein